MGLLGGLIVTRQGYADPATAKPIDTDIELFALYHVSPTIFEGVAPLNGHVFLCHVFTYASHIRNLFTNVSALHSLGS